MSTEMPLPEAVKSIFSGKRDSVATGHTSAAIALGVAAADVDVSLVCIRVPEVLLLLPPEAFDTVEATERERMCFM
jgi:hypothetical protein